MNQCKTQSVPDRNKLLVFCSPLASTYRCFCERVDFVAETLIPFEFEPDDTIQGVAANAAIYTVGRFEAIYKNAILTTRFLKRYIDSRLTQTNLENSIYQCFQNPAFRKTLKSLSGIETTCKNVYLMSTCPSRKTLFADLAIETIGGAYPVACRINNRKFGESVPASSQMPNLAVSWHCGGWDETLAWMQIKI